MLCVTILWRTACWCDAQGIPCDEQHAQHSKSNAVRHMENTLQHSVVRVQWRAWNVFYICRFENVIDTPRCFCKYISQPMSNCWIKLWCHCIVFVARQIGFVTNIVATLINTFRKTCIARVSDWIRVSLKVEKQNSFSLEFELQKQYNDINVWFVNCFWDSTINWWIDNDSSMIDEWFSNEQLIDRTLKNAKGACFDWVQVAVKSIFSGWI